MHCWSSAGCSNIRGHGGEVGPEEVKWEMSDAWAWRVVRDQPIRSKGEASP